MRVTADEKQVRRTSILTLILLSIAACEGGAGGPVADGAGTASQPATEGSAPVSQPATRPGEAALEAETLAIEGMPQVVPVQAVASPPDFPLAFTTVAPTDMLVDYVSSGEGDGVRFEAAFSGVHVPEAALAMSVLPVGTTADDAREWVAEVAGGTPREMEADRPSWMVESFTLRGEQSGFAALGEREGRWFYFLASYPPEFGDGIGPRIDLILSRWRWSDGSGLSTTP